MLSHYKALGNLRKSQEALQKGYIHFFCATGGKIGFTRTFQDKELKIYVNHSNEPWVIPQRKVLYANNLTDSLLPMGYCVMEE